MGRGQNRFISKAFTDYPSPSLISTIAGTTLLNEVVEKKETVILSALKTPQSVLTAEQQAVAKVLLSQVMTTLNNHYGANHVADLANITTTLPTDAKLSALIIMDFTAHILKYGADNTGYVYKYLSLHHQPSGLSAGPSE